MKITLDHHSFFFVRESYLWAYKLGLESLAHAVRLSLSELRGYLACRRFSKEKIAFFYP